MNFDSCIQGSSKKYHAEILILWNKNKVWRIIAFEDSERSIRCTNCSRYHNIAFCSSFFGITIGGSFFRDCCNGKTYNEVTQFSTQSDIFGKILLIQQNRKINLQEFFSYPLGPIPWALAEANGELKKSSKAKIMHELGKGVPRVEQVDAPFIPIFDGMALVCMVKCTSLMYNQFADDFLKLVVAKSCGSKRMDVVFDVY